MGAMRENGWEEEKRAMKRKEVISNQCREQLQIQESCAKR